MVLGFEFKHLPATLPQSPMSLTLPLNNLPTKHRSMDNQTVLQVMHVMQQGERDTFVLLVNKTFFYFLLMNLQIKKRRAQTLNLLGVQAK